MVNLHKNALLYLVDIAACNVVYILYTGIVNIDN